MPQPISEFKQALGVEKLGFVDSTKSDYKVCFLDVIKTTVLCKAEVADAFKKDADVPVYVYPVTEDKDGNPITDRTVYSLSLKAGAPITLEM